MSLVYSSPLAVSLFWGSYLAFVLVDARLILRSVAKPGTRRGSSIPQGLVHRHVGFGSLVVTELVGLGTASIGALVLPWRWPLLAVGLIIASSGIALRLAAKRTLGRFFVGAVAIQADHHVVTDGPYAMIRHPGYAGTMLALLGLGLATANILTIALYVLIPAYIFARTIPVEEAALTDALGQPYSNYCHKTSRLVPHVW